MKIIATEHRTHRELRVINFDDVPRNNSCNIIGSVDNSYPIT